MSDPTTNTFTAVGHTVESPGNNTRLVVHCEGADGAPVDVHFDVTNDEVRLRYVDWRDAGGVELFSDSSVVDTAIQAITK